MLRSCLLALAVGCNSSQPAQNNEPPRADPPRPSSSADACVDPWSAPRDAAVAPVFEIAALAKLEVADAAGRTSPLGPRLRDVNVISFWASWCKPCIAELPKLDKLYASQRGRAGVAMIAVNLDDPDHHADAVKAVARLHLAMPVVFDPDGETYNVLYPGPMVVIPAVAVVTKTGDRDTRGGPSEEPTEALVARYRARIDDGLAGKLGVLPTK